MNNRYQELAYEATEWCEKNSKGYLVAWEWEEKFAELIIKECAHLAGRAAYPENNEVVLQTIKRHFGIEE